VAISCSNCGKELPDGARFCSECGTMVAVEEEKKPEFCINCFAELSKDAKFCLQCGNPAIAAMKYYTPPEKDQTILDKLIASAPQQEKYRAYQIAVKAWEASDQDYKKPEFDLNDIVDFERNQGEIAMRARKWAEYETSGMRKIDFFQELAISGMKWGVTNAWSSEPGWFRTNKPNHHKALFYETFINAHLYILRRQFALTYDDPPQPTPYFLDYLRKVRDYTEEEIQEFDLLLPDMREIKRWPQKDDELFPPPQPVQVEVAGAIVNFTTDEAVVIVYLDCIYKGKEVSLGSVREEELDVPWQKATVIERTADGIPICAVIFRPVPFATERMKNREKVLNQVKVEVDASWAEDISNVSHEEGRKLTFDKILWFDTRQEAILFKGNVTQLDWRGKRGKVQYNFDDVRYKYSPN
jgi:Double zinc ribbon